MPSSTVLDYASPRAQGKTRLPSRSILRVNTSAAGVEVIETLSGRFGAIAAIIFAVFTFSIVLSCIHEIWDVAGSLVWILAALGLAEAVTMLSVIHNTWRRTRLSADSDGLTLEFEAPLARLRRLRWPAGEVAEIRVVSTDAFSGLGQLQIRPSAQMTVHLFTDHRERSLQKIAAAMIGTLMPGNNPATITGAVAAR